MSEVTQPDVEFVRSIMTDLLIAGANGDKDAWRAVENKASAYRIAERERCAAAAESVQQEQLTKSLNTPAKNSSMIHARNGALAAATKILKAIRGQL